jgi:hypothetical protein
MKKFIKGLFIFSLILVSCRRESDADNFLIGSKLNLNILKKCEVIYFTKNYLVLYIDFREKGDFASDMALFFYDKKLKLTNKAFPIDFETIKGNKVTFFGNINELDISNFPKEFYFEKFYKPKYSGGISIENKIITNSNINKKSKKISLQINKTTTDLFAVNELVFPLTDSLLLKDFPIKDTLRFKLEELSLDSNSITYNKEVRMGFYESHNLFFQSNLQKEQFYREILKCIGFWCKC